MSLRLPETGRLIIRLAADTPEDIDVYFRLWNDPRVMRLVGFPDGLHITREEVRKLIGEWQGDPLTAKLLVVRREDGAGIGECKLGRPDENGVCVTDVKLLPEYWGNGYGVEVKQALVDCLFEQTDCRVVQATPNLANVASQRMQERVGAVRVGKAVFRFEKPLKIPTCDVPHYVYELTREVWEARRRQ